MGRMLGMTLMAVAIIIAFQLAGINVGLDGFSNLMNLATGNITTSDFFTQLFSSVSGILVLVGTATLALGLITRGQLENFIVLPFIIGTLSIMTGVFIALIDYTSNLTPEFLWVGNVVLIFMSLFSVAYIITMVEWFRGNV